jgi:hypothetical protein
VQATRVFSRAIFIAAAICSLGSSTARPRGPQEASQKPAEKAPEKAPENAQEKPAAKATPKLPAEIELLETRVRFETDGSSRKEVHARAKINDELGVRQFARLNFNFNRAFEQIEIPLVRITHASGGTADVLPSAITDNPNPAVVNAPAYQDVRVKSVRILGLEPGDTLEYRVVTTSSPRQLLAPNFYLTHDFANDGVAKQEVFEVDLPASRAARRETSSAAREFETERSGTGASARILYRWKHPVPTSEADGHHSPSPERAIVDLPFLPSSSDVAISSFPGWAEVLIALEKPFGMMSEPSANLKAKAQGLVANAKTADAKLRALYDFVAQKIRTVDLPIGATGYALRPADEVLSSGYAVPEDKCLLLVSLAGATELQAQPALAVLDPRSEHGPALPSVFTNILVVARVNGKDVWLDPSAEVAPFGLIAASLRGKPALLPFPRNDVRFFEDIPNDLPFTALQSVGVDASLAADGKLTAKVRYSMRGDNELLLRVAFHQTSREKWDGVAQLLALSDGFRGQVAKTTASDPYETHDPFTVEYEIAQPKFVDWSKKPLRIPAILPLIGLPDPPAKPAAGKAPVPIDLGTPLDVTVSVTLHLPGGTAVSVPTGTSVERDFATYSSQYSAKDSSLKATRHLNFILKEIPADRAADYNAFLRAVQNDESQFFTLERPDADAARPPKP